MVALATSLVARAHAAQARSRPVPAAVAAQPVRGAT
jgi:hypothetical protein